MFGKRKIPIILIILIIISNFSALILVENGDKVTKQHEKIVSYPNKMGSVSNLANESKMESGEKYTSSLTNESRIDYWQFTILAVNQRVYIDINFSTSTPIIDTEMLFLDSNKESFTLENEAEIVRLENQRSISVSTTFRIRNEYYFVLNGSTLEEFPETGYNYTIHMWAPNKGFNFQTALPLETGVHEYSLHVKGEKKFFSINAELNQRIFIESWSHNNQEPVLLDTEMLIYEDYSGEKNLIDFFEEETGYLNATWKAELSEKFFIQLESSVDTFYAGNFSIRVMKQEKGFDFETAIDLKVNQTQVGYINYTGKYEEKIYYKFYIPHNGIDVNFIINETQDSILVLDESIVTIYDPGKNQAIVNKLEREAEVNGRIEGSFFAATAGYYYLIVHADSDAGRLGSFHILISHELPKPYHWQLFAILLTIFFLLVIPLALYLTETRYLSTVVDEKIFNIEASRKKVFNRFNDNPRFFDKKTVPNKLIYLRMSKFNGAEIKIEFEKLDKNVTELRIKRLRKPFEIFQYLLVGVLLYYFVNLFNLFLHKESLLPFNIHSISVITPLFIVIAIILVIGYFFTSGFWNYQYSNFLFETKYTLNNIRKEKLESESHTDIVMDREQAQKNISYVRVLWNQARKYFKENNYGMFIIKADSAVKKLVETRFLQVMGDDKEKIGKRFEFHEIIEELRAEGFDVPSLSKIEYIRKLRNKIVHSSLVIDEKKAVDIFSYYTKFLSRLGLRT